jgi:hypothetical protein
MIPRMRPESASVTSSFLECLRIAAPGQHPRGECGSHVLTAPARDDQPTFGAHGANRCYGCVHVDPDVARAHRERESERARGREGERARGEKRESEKAREQESERARERERAVQVHYFVDFADFGTAQADDRDSSSTLCMSGPATHASTQAVVGTTPYLPVE